MSIKSSVALLAAGAVAMAATLTPGQSVSAEAQTAQVTDFSSAQQQKKGAAPKAGGPRHGAPRVGAPKMMGPKAGGAKIGGPKIKAPKTGGAKIGGPKAGGPKIGAPKAGGPKIGTPKVGGPKAGGAKVVTPRVFTPKGANAGKVIGGKLRGMPGRGAGQAFIHGKKYSAWRHGYRVRRDGGWRTFVALSALGAIVVGGSYFYPYAYISAPGDYCEGVTADGCQLVWEEVETIEGDLVWQCVAYCPWR